jgi:hypothetical protein
MCMYHQQQVFSPSPIQEKWFEYVDVVSSESNVEY